MESKLTGFDEARKLLESLPINLEKKVLQDAVNSALREARKDIAAAAPRSEDQSERSKKYGRLSRNIRVQKLKKVKRNERGARVHTGNAFWGLFIEFGTRYIAARPWFAPAFRKAQDKMIKTVAEKIGEGIESEARGLR